MKGLALTEGASQNRCVELGVSPVTVSTGGGDLLNGAAQEVSSDLKTFWLQCLGASIFEGSY